MNKQKNCPNCGAPYEYGINKCPYCGTIYFDLSIIDFDSKQPIFLTIKKDNLLITQQAIPSRCKIDYTIESISAVTGKGNSIMESYFSPSLKTEISFDGIIVDNKLIDVAPSY